MRRAVILHGAVAAEAPPDEQDVLVQVEVVAAALERLGYPTEAMSLTLDLESARQRLERRRPLLVFNLVESLAGSGRLSHLGATLLEALGLPYTGAPLRGLFLSSDKLAAKRLLALDRIATPAGPDEAHIGPWIVKSVWEHGSIGLDDDSLVSETSRLAEAMTRRRRRFGGEWYAERYVEGREFNLSLLGGGDATVVLPPAEIRFADFPPDKPRIVGYPAKWAPDSFEYRHTVRTFPGPEDQSLLDELETLARRCWRLFGLRGYARVDFRVDDRGEPWVLEVNSNPCLAPDAGFMAAAGQAGLSYDDVIGRIVEDALAARPSV